jgi:NAD(P)-dependent dehydrogenase (short-subunit alcohol dehydrogenase family)
MSDWTDFELTGRFAAVTAASRGMGRAIALRLARAGADIAVCSRHGEHLEEISSLVGDMGRKCLAIESHMGTKEGIQLFFDRFFETYPRIDVLVNCLGINPMMAALVDLPEEAWDKIMNSNLKSLLLTSQIAAKSMMKNGGGSIINLSSVGGIRPAPMLGAYSISKAALNMMTQVMALELGQHNIRVNAICPGLIKTRFSQAIWDNPQREQSDAQVQGVPTTGEPEDIAGLALYLASDAARFVTGECIMVKGKTS